MDAPEIVAAICTELSESGEADVFIRMARENTDRRFFGGQYQYAVAYRACHLFTVTRGAGGNAAAGIGQVASMSEGGLSMSFATSAASSAADGGLETTKYGKMLLGLIRSRPAMGANGAGLRAARAGGAEQEAWCL